MMNEKQVIESLSKLYQNVTGQQPTTITLLPASGSYRRYFRMAHNNEKSIIGAWNEDRRENEAFCSFTQHFHNQGINVPELLAQDLDNNVYLLQDLGDTSLLSVLLDNRQEDEFPEIAEEAYRNTLSQLPRIQIEGGQNLDFEKAYPRKAFDRQSMMWDLNYFKYYFLKLARVPFDEQKLEDEYVAFCDFLLEADCSYFLYRDFQSRNIMMQGCTPWFIDYQGGRKGALQYDVASILFEAKTALTPEVRTKLLEHYLVELQKYSTITRETFMHHYSGYALIRIMQAMGAYGFRGLFEKKELFLQSIPSAIDNLKWLIDNTKLPVRLHELEKVLRYLVDSTYIRELADTYINLTVNVNSFSYRRGIPVDESSNGGGYVFDCRTVHNPGRYDQYKPFNGRDEIVQLFFRQEPEMDNFLKGVFMLVDQSVEKYLKSGFKNLMVNFGCTGGQHRSVYSAEMLAKHLKSKYNIRVVLRHREIEMKEGIAPAKS
jgi:aminoglycoside/choline kinase family phosphotransferase